MKDRIRVGVVRVRVRVRDRVRDRVRVRVQVQVRVTVRVGDSGRRSGWRKRRWRACAYTPLATPSVLVSTCNTFRAQGATQLAERCRLNT